MPATEIKSNAANIRGILRRNPNSTIRYASPDPWPADPAAISATIAPIKREPAADPEAREKIRQSRGQPEQHELLHARGAIHLEQVNQIVVRRREPERGVGQQRKERHQKCAHQDRYARSEVDQQQWRDGDDRRHLHGDGERIERPLDQSRLRENNCQRDAANDSDRESLERNRSVTHSDADSVGQSVMRVAMMRLGAGRR